MTSTGMWCIVVAAGSGRRFGGAKQFEPLDGRRVVDRSIATAASVCDGVVVVLPAADVDDELVRAAGADVVVAGGSTRSGSVRAGLAAVPTDAAVVLVHDAARPLASVELFERVGEAVFAGAPAVIPVVPVSDTIRRVGGGVVDRDELRAVQTPQGFDAATLRLVHGGFPEASDDAGLIEAAGGTVELVDGEATNLKLTNPFDSAVATTLLREIERAGGIADAERVSDAATFDGEGGSVLADTEPGGGDS